MIEKYSFELRKTNNGRKEDGLRQWARRRQHDRLTHEQQRREKVEDEDDEDDLTAVLLVLRGFD